VKLCEAYTPSSHSICEAHKASVVICVKVSYNNCCYNVWAATERSQQPITGNVRAEIVTSAVNYCDALAMPQHTASAIANIKDAKHLWQVTGAAMHTLSVRTMPRRRGDL